MSLDFDFSKMKWEGKGRTTLAAWGTDVYISSPRWENKHMIRFAFRNNKIPESVKYMQISVLGNYILFKKADARRGWRICDGNSNMAAKIMQITENVLSNETREFILKHKNEGFDLFYDSKNDVYYIDTTKAVEE